LPPAVLPLLLLSALVETAYTALLVSAYAVGDFSLVYPLARGAAPALLALWSWLFLGERITSGGAAGLGVLLGGLLITGSSGWLSQPRQAPAANAAGEPAGRLLRRAPGGSGLALLVALMISIYSALDGAAVRHAPPSRYSLLVLALTGLLYFPLALRRCGAPALWSTARRRWRRIALVGLLNLGAYTLVLNAYAIAPLSYGGAVREVSVVIGALAGWKLLGEPLGRRRVLGAAVIFAGVLLIAAAG
ncbi:MAG: EamA family transporter, partial [Chloroflexota bacterium]